MPKKKELAGQKFGRLTVIQQDIEKSKEKKRVYWFCRCECGTEKSIVSGDLLGGKTLSCGCLRNERVRAAVGLNLLGQRFGKLTVTELIPYDKDDVRVKRQQWRCKCDCGNEIITSSLNLQNGDTKSCGCYNKEMVRKTKLKDLKGQRFGKLIVLELDEEEMKHRKNQDWYDSQAYWKCQCDCGNITTISSGHLLKGITQSCGCICSQGETQIENWLKENNIQYIHQYKFSDLRGSKGGILSFDFAIFSDKVLKCLIEYNGKQHYEPIEYFGGEEKFKHQIINDNLKIQYCKDNNIPLHIIRYDEEIDLSFLKGE